MPLSKGTQIVVTNSSYLADEIGVGSIGSIINHIDDLNDGIFSLYNVEFKIPKDNNVEDYLLRQVISERHFKVTDFETVEYMIPWPNRTKIYDDEEVI